MTKTAVRDMIFVVHAQLPAGIRDKLAVDVETDAYHLNPTAIFRDGQGREWRCALEPTLIEGIEVRSKIPETFVAQLCAVT